MTASSLRAGLHPARGAGPPSAATPNAVAATSAASSRYTGSALPIVRTILSSFLQTRARKTGQAWWVALKGRGPGVQGAGTPATNMFSSPIDWKTGPSRENTASDLGASDLWQLPTSPGGFSRGRELAVTIESWCRGARDASMPRPARRQHAAAHAAARSRSTWHAACLACFLPCFSFVLSVLQCSQSTLCTEGNSGLLKVPASTGSFSDGAQKAAPPSLQRHERSAMQAKGIQPKRPSTRQRTPCLRRLIASQHGLASHRPPPPPPPPLLGMICAPHAAPRTWPGTL